MNKKYWISCNKFTVLIETDSKGLIIDAAPVVKKFIGQPINNLCRWFKKFGEVRYAKIFDEESSYTKS